MTLRRSFCFMLIAVIVLSVCGYVLRTVQSVTYETDQVHRQDAKRKSTYLLSSEDYVEFQLSPGTTTLRLMTNAALNSLDAPDYDLSNPRVGWKYAVDFQLLDDAGDVLRESEYHFRSPIRQLIDEETQQIIYPLFFGHNSLVATQTRTMQLALNAPLDQAQRLRVRLRNSSPQIQAVVVRVVARVERDQYQDQNKWKKIPQRQREEMTKYCVYNHDMLTADQRKNLLRWQWKKCHVVEDNGKWNLFSIGDIDDEEVRPEQFPEGLLCDPTLFGSIPIPEGRGTLTLHCVRPGASEATMTVDSSLEYLTVDYFGEDSNQRFTSLYPLKGSSSTTDLEVNGGLLILKPSTDLVVRARWAPKDAVALKSAQVVRAERLVPTTVRMLDETTPSSTESVQRPLEITPQRKALRTYLIGPQPLTYAISHVDNNPTPVKLQLRLPFSQLFENTIQDQPQADTQTRTQIDSLMVVDWKVLGASLEVLAHGTLRGQPEPSTYDFLLLNSQRERLSDPLIYYFELPVNAKYLKLSSHSGLYLGSLQVRPLHLQQVTRLPEDLNAFARRRATNRSWFGLNPTDRTAMMRDNRTFVISLGDRPPTEDWNIEAKKWQRYVPDGNWIGSQLLVPKSTDEQQTFVPSDDVGTEHSYFRVSSNENLDFTKHPEIKSALQDIPVSIVFSASDPIGDVDILLNDQPIAARRILSTNGTWRLKLPAVKCQSELNALRIQCDTPCDFYVHGLHFSGRQEYYRRTAQRLDLGRLRFEYERAEQIEEYLTLRIFSREESTRRLKVQVEIVSEENATQKRATQESSANKNAIENRITGSTIEPRQSWTPMKRLFDLRPDPADRALLLGSGKMTGEGYRCLVRLGEELPVGTYQISIEPEDSTLKAAVLVYQMKPERSVVPEITVRRIQP